MVVLTVQMTSQTIVANCNQVIVTGVGAAPVRTTTGPLIAVLNGRTDVDCNVIVPTTNDYVILNRVYTLFQVINNQNVAVAERTGIALPTFSNLPAGTYFVTVADPLEDQSVCRGVTRGPFKVANLLLQVLGWTAAPPTFLSGLIANFNVRTSNNVIVGRAQLVDNTWSFLDGAGFWFGNSAPPAAAALYGANDVVRINGSASKNYDAFFLAIYEIYPNGSPGRSTSLGGWQYENIGVRDLSEIWRRTAGWTFNTGFKYRVQLAISNGNCGSWTEVTKTFMVCSDPYSSCRVGGDQLTAMSISPNPTSDKFLLNGVDFSLNKNYEVTISDISGKILASFEHPYSNEFSANSLKNGVYIVSLIEGKRTLFSSKLIVNK